MRTFDAFESPGLIVYPDRVKRNIFKAIEMAAETMKGGK